MVLCGACVRGARFNDRLQSTTSELSAPKLERVCVPRVAYKNPRGFALLLFSPRLSLRLVRDLSLACLISRGVAWRGVASSGGARDGKD